MRLLRLLPPKRLIIFLLLTRIPVIAFCQSTTDTDSLLVVWRNLSSPDSARLDAGEELQRLYVVSGQLDALKAISDSMIATGRKNRNPEWEGLGHHGWGRYLEHTGKPKDATVQFEKALQLFSATKNPVRIALCRLSLSALAYRNGNTEQAIQLIDDAEAILDTVIHQTELCKIYQYRGAIAYNTGQYLQALQYNQLAEEYCGASGELRVMASALLNTGNIFTIFDMQELARQNLVKAADILTSLEEGRSLALAQSSLVLASKNLTEAKEHFDKGIQIADSKNFQDVELSLLLAYGKALLDSGQVDPAFRHLSRCVKLAEELNNTSVRLNAHSSIAEIYLIWGLPEKSIKLCRQILVQAENSKRKDHLQKIYGTLGIAYGQTGRKDSAVYYLQQKVNIMEELQKDKNIAEIVRHFLTYQNNKENEINQIKHKHALREKESALVQKNLFIRALLIVIVILGSLAFSLYRFYTFKKKSEQQLIAINKQLESERSLLALNNAKLKRFTSIVSHDILSNLDLILSTGNVLVGARPNTETLSRYYDLSQRTSRQLKEYCLGLLEEARRAPEEETTAPNDPMPVVHQVLARFGTALRAANFQVELGELSATLLPAALVEQLFQNLVSNALRHAAAGPAPLLRIAEETDGMGRTLWVVEDNGPGVPADKRELIFSPQVKENGNAGQRMGLSLLRAGLRERGADIWVEDRQGGGARFVVMPGA